MGYAVVHMQKIKASGLRGIQSHVNREHTPKTNPDVDSSRTKDNYDLISCHDFSWHIKQIIKTQATETKTVRKDAVVCCNFIITSDFDTMSELGFDQQRTFFADSVKWFSDRYGSQNIVNATVHMDEKTPHMHLGLVPIHGGRLSAKTLFTPAELHSIQSDFVDQVGKKYGLVRGKEGSERQHLTERQFKLQSLYADIEQAERKKMSLEKAIKSLESDFSRKQLSIQDVNRIRPQKSITGALKGITLEDIENLKTLAVEGIRSRSVIDDLQKENSRLKRLVPGIDEQLKQAKMIKRLDQLEKIVAHLPPELRPPRTFKQKQKQGPTLTR